MEKEERSIRQKRYDQSIKVDVNIYHHSDSDAKVCAKLDELIETILRQGVIMAGELSDLQTKVQANTDVVDSAVTLIQGIKKKLDDAIASNDPAALTALSTALGESNQQLADAVAAGTPAETP